MKVKTITQCLTDDFGNNPIENNDFIAMLKCLCGEDLLSLQLVGDLLVVTTGESFYHIKKSGLKYELIRTGELTKVNCVGNQVKLQRVC